jgi:hypothetical protein
VDDEGYEGAAVLNGEIPVWTALSGYVDPLDGLYHWGGRIHPDERVVALLRAGKRDVTLQVNGAEPLPARLSEADPWGGVLVAATGGPPWPAPEAACNNPANRFH